ncbi:PH domain-containing protein [Yaniella halotolerans]|uniref:PH domain-containing protein n=1 Tax=Yaniella halotolerans TaxID=225453 RepID=UPI0003B6F12D|nr:PH domain-containing protein [Yaniella halotolerans]
MRSHYVTGEHLLVRTRAHPSVLIRPAWNLVLWAMLSGFISGVLSSYALPEFLRTSATTLTTIALGLIAIGVFLSVVRPAWQWLVSRYEITTHRVAHKLGAIAVKRHWVALHSLVSLQIRQSRSQRRRGSGDLHLMNSRGQTWVLQEIPKVSEFQTLVDTERFGSYGRYTGGPLSESRGM